MLRKLSTLLALALCLGMLAACAPSENDTTVVGVSTNETTQSETDITSAEMFEDDTTVEETEAEETTVEAPKVENDTTLDKTYLETNPPLSEEDLAMAVPEFLTEEQQLLYRRASNVYAHVFSVSPSFVEYKETLNYTCKDYVYFENEYGWRYKISQGRYQNWDDFMQLILSVFTEDFFNSKNKTPRFIEINHKLAFADALRGGSQFYNHNFQDEFELVSISDSEIVFNVIGHYSQIHPKEGESYDERDVRCAEGWETTDKFTIRMVMTESGWRFDEFYHPAIDERTAQVDGKLRQFHANNSTG